MNTKQYDASQIKILGGIEAVRQRPSMYIGTTSEAGLYHLVEEVVDNSIDEALAGFCKNISVVVNKDGSVTVIDDGRGIPVDTHKQTGKSALEVVLTTLHAGGKFGQGNYKVSGGLHGVGVSVVNALSEWMEVEVYRDGKVYQQKYQRGNPVTKVEAIGKTDLQGTKVTFLPDKAIFQETIEIKADDLKHRLKELSFLNPKLKITLVEQKSGQKDIFYSEEGIPAYIRYLNEKKELLFEKPIALRAVRDNVEMEVALQYCKDYYDEHVVSFANDIKTKEGGTHLSGFRSALTRSINDFARKAEIFKNDNETFSGNDVREGLTAVVSVKLSNPQFEGQTKTKLGNGEIKGLVESVVYDGLNDAFATDPRTARAICEKCLEAYRVRAAVRKAQELARRKNYLENTVLPGKLADCSERDPALCEIFIVEGDSAGGSAKQGRDRRFQAILPLRGKIINVEKARADKILANEEIRAMITAIGPKVVEALYGTDSEESAEGSGNGNGNGNSSASDNLRYHKIVIMTDADVDGAHIRTLLLTFFFRHARSVIENGHLYIAQPPLYLVKKGENKQYAYNDKQLEEVLKAIGKDKVHLQRYKGLGEMNPEQLWETTMNPGSRTMLQVRLEDAEAADEIFTVLMGSAVEPRREFIQAYAKKVRWLDV